MSWLTPVGRTWRRGKAKAAKAKAKANSRSSLGHSLCLCIASKLWTWRYAAALQGHIKSPPSSSSACSFVSKQSQEQLLATKARAPSAAEVIARLVRETSRSGQSRLARLCRRGGYTEVSLCLQEVCMCTGMHPRAFGAVCSTNGVSCRLASRHTRSEREFNKMQMKTER